MSMSSIERSVLEGVLATEGISSPCVDDVVVKIEKIDGNQEVKMDAKEAVKAAKLQAKEEAKEAVEAAKLQVKEAAKAAKLQAKEEAKEAVKATKLQEKETAKAAKLQEKEDAKAAKLQEKEDAKAAKLQEKENAKAAKLQEKENAKIAKKEAKRLAAIAARAEAKASKVPRAKKNSTKSDAIQEVVVLQREDIPDNVQQVDIQKPSCVSDTAVLEEEECIDVEEVCCNGVIYLLSSDNLVYDGGHEEVGRWCNGVVVLHSGDCVPRTPSLIQGTASPEPPL